MTKTIRFDCFRREFVLDDTSHDGRTILRRRFDTAQDAKAAAPDALVGRPFHFGCEHDTAR